MKSALAIGGVGALSTATSLFGSVDVAEASSASEATRSVGVEERDNRQHAWDEYEPNVRGTSAPPHYHLVLQMNYQGDGTPSGRERYRVELALESLEYHFDWKPDGLMFTVGYSPSYFDRFDEDLPGDLSSRDTSTGLIDPEVTIQATAAPHEDPAEIDAETYDAALHMASNDVRHLLMAEEALWGNGDLHLFSTFEGIFSKPTEYPGRQTGFAGAGITKSRYEDNEEVSDLAENIPAESGLSMGFNALFGNSVPKEEFATMVEDQKLTAHAPPGMFAQGSVEHVSRLDINLDDWYGNNDLEERREQMFSPHHTREETGKVGENLGTSNDSEAFPTRSTEEEDLGERVVEDAKEEEIVGHIQKLGRSRFDMEKRVLDPEDEPDDQVLEQPILRRDVDTLDRDVPGTLFIALMRFNGYMHYVRQAMNGTEFDTAAFGLTGDNRIQQESVVDIVGDTDDDGDTVVGDEDSDGDNNNGIVPYLTTQRRGNYLVPPLTNRSLPSARGIRPNEGDGEKGFEVRSTVQVDRPGRVAVVLRNTSDLRVWDLDFDTLRFGEPETVNKGGGAEPIGGSYGSDRIVVYFDSADAGFTEDTQKARLVAKTEFDAGRETVFATDTDLKVESGDDDDGELDSREDCVQRIRALVREARAELRDAESVAELRSIIREYRQKIAEVRWQCRNYL